MASAYALPTNSLALTENDHDHRHSRNASRSSNASTNDSSLNRTTTNGSMQPPSISFHDTNGRPVSLYSANDFYSIKSQSTTSLAPPTALPGAREGLGLRIDDGMTLKSEAYPSIRTPIGGEPIAQSTGHEILSFLLFPLPLLVASIGFASRSYDLAKPDGADIGYTQLRKQVLDNVPSTASSARVASGLMEVLTLTSATLMLLGLINKIQALSQLPLSRNHASNSTFLNQIKNISIVNVIQDVGLRVAGIALPYFATMTLGGQRSSHIILSAIVLCSTPLRAQTDSKSALEPWRGLFKAKAFLAAVLVMICADFAGYGASLSRVDLVFGYSSLLLAISLLLTTPNTFVQSWSNDPQTARTPTVRTPVSPPSSWKTGSDATSDKSADDNILLLSGAVLFAATIAIAYISDQSPPLSLTWLICSTLAVAFAILVAKVVNPAYLTQSRPLGYAVSSTFIAIFNAISSSTSISRQLVNFAIITLTATAVLLECSASRPKDVNPFGKRRHAHHKPGQFSHFTTLILSYCEPDSLLYSIISEKDSRRIAYFTCLNFAFMFVQGLYGYLSGSLGLLSDTVHMFFDCLGLVVGLGAAVASKWPSSPERPFGWEKLNTLAGFGNGVFLMLVSVEFVWEAIEGMLEGRELRRVKELFVVSTLGMIVNLIGLLAFGHAHAGHDHGHGHSHGSSHDHHDHAGHSHDHHHHNENMHGIFLHVAADAGGSLAVIISTALTLWYPWYLWDPLATIIIAVLIFAAAVPLVVSSGQKLLLIVPEETEYGIKNFLQEVGQVRGVIGYAVPRFWMIEAGNEDAHKHEHEHEHAHNHGHSHGHSHATETHHAHHHNHNESGHHQHDHNGHHSAEEHGHGHDHHHHHDHHDHHHDHNHAHAHEHKSSHDHDHSHESKSHSHDAKSKEHVHEECCHGSSRLTGSLHVIAAPLADLEDIRERVEELAVARKMKILVHVEYEIDSHCWCGGSQKS